MCVFTAGWGSICVRLTHWEPLAAGSPAGSKSSGWPEAWNPSRPGQMSLCSARLSLQRPHGPLKTFEANSSSQNADQTMARPNWITSHPTTVIPKEGYGVIYHIHHDFETDIKDEPQVNVHTANIKYCLFACSIAVIRLFKLYLHLFFSSRSQN